MVDDCPPVAFDKTYGEGNWQNANTMDGRPTSSLNAQLQILDPGKPDLFTACSDQLKLGALKTPVVTSVDKTHSAQTPNNPAPNCRQKGLPGHEKNRPNQTLSAGDASV